MTAPSGMLSMFYLDDHHVPLSFFVRGIKHVEAAKSSGFLSNNIYTLKGPILISMAMRVGIQ